MFKIEKGIPIPAARGGNGLTAAIRGMKVGESILLSKKQALSVGKIASNVGAKLLQRTVSPTEMRIWRVA